MSAHSSGKSFSAPDPKDNSETERGFWAWLKSFRRNNTDSDLRESLVEVIEEHEDAGETLEPEQRKMLANVLDFGELSVADIMVPRADIEALPLDASLADVIETVTQAGHSRLPIYRDQLDDVVGFVHIKDSVGYWNRGDDFVLEKVLRDVMYVPRSMLAVELLARMRDRRTHIAIVVDEFGGTDGLVTIEDVVEEVVGEIEDEHDAGAVHHLTLRDDGDYDADARVALSELEEELKVDFLPDAEDEHIETVGGLVVSLFERVPGKGETIRHDNGLVFEVIDCDPRRVKLLRIRDGRTPEQRLQSEYPDE